MSFNKQSAIDNANRISFNTVFGDKIVAQKRPDVDIQFNLNVSTEDTLITHEDGVADVTHENHMLKLIIPDTAPTPVIGDATICSKRVIRYRPGFEQYAIFTVMFENGGVNNTIQHMGPFKDEIDGFYVGYTNEDFVVGKLNDGDVFEVKQKDWNILQFNGRDAPEVDFTKMNIFKISWGWLGTAVVNFEKMSEEGLWQIFHRMEFPGTLNEPHIANSYLPVTATVKSTGSLETPILRSGSINGGVVMGIDTEASHRKFTFDHTQAILKNVEVTLFTIRNKTVYQGSDNRIPLLLDYTSLLSDGTKACTFKFYKNSVLVGESFSDINTEESVTEVDVTATSTNGKLLFGASRTDISSDPLDLKPRKIEIEPGETITITAFSKEITTVEAILGWDELF